LYEPGGVLPASGHLPERLAEGRPERRAALTAGDP
jgi:hypothetical protein